MVYPNNGSVSRPVTNCKIFESVTFPLRPPEIAKQQPTTSNGAEAHNKQ